MLPNYLKILTVKIIISLLSEMRERGAHQRVTKQIKKENYRE
jgi:hypothetical protein